MSNYRAPLRILQSNWTTGEVDPISYMRVDAQGYTGGAKQLKNMLVRSTGATERRPGLLTVADMGTLRRRLIDFQFDANEKYVCAFGNADLDIYSADGTLVQSLATGISEAASWEMTVVQKGDVMIICHTSFQMTRLRRTGLNSFVWESLYFSADPSQNVFNHPMIKYQPANVYMSVSDTSPGSGRTILCNSGIFTSAWVGERIRIYDCEIAITAINSSTSAVGTVCERVKERLGIAPLRATAGAALVEVTHVQHGLTNGSTVIVKGAGQLFNIPASSINGARSMVMIDDDHYNILADTVADTSGDGGGGGITIETSNFTTRWTEQVFSNRHGWPGAVCLHENRLWLGGNRDLPTFLAGSAIGDYYDFNVRDGFDDESVQGLISSVSRIVHLVSSKQLQIFCESSEAYIETQNGEPITPGSFKVVNQTSYGTSLYVRPRVFDGATIFSQRSGKNIREFVYDFNTDSHVSAAVSVRASHLIDHPFDLAVLLGTNSRPEQYAFFVNADGTVACFHSIRNEGLAAWTHFTLSYGSFSSVCVIGTSIFFSVYRGGRYYLERLELDQSDIWLDGAIKVAGGPSDTWALGARFANTTVTVMANGYKIAIVAADASGTVTLPYIVAGPVVAGYDYGITIEPLSFDMSMSDGPMTGEKRRIVSATLHYHQSVSAAVNGAEQLGFTIGQDPSLPPVRISGKKRIRLLGYDRDPGFVVTQPNPGPLTVLGMVMEVSI